MPDTPKTPIITGHQSPPTQAGKGICILLNDSRKDILPTKRIIIETHSAITL